MTKWRQGGDHASDVLMMTVVMSFAMATVFACVAIAIFIAGGWRFADLPGWGVGRVLLFYFAGAIMASVIIGPGLLVLPQGRFRSVALGTIVGVCLYYLFSWMDPTTTGCCGIRDVVLSLLTGTAAGVPGGLIVHSVMQGFRLPGGND
jgi:hypothetical protein